MSRYVFVLGLALAATNANAQERNYTIRGSGYLEPTGPSPRVAMQEVRLTLRDNGEFLATLFARGERILVQGRWTDRGRGDRERVEISNAFGVRADGDGALYYERGVPTRLTLNGRTREGGFRVELLDEDMRGRDDRYPDDRRRRGDLVLGSGNRVYANVDAVSPGLGMVRMSGVRDGRFQNARVRLGTARDVRIDIDRNTRGTIRGEIQEVRGSRVMIRIDDMFGYRATGQLTVEMRNEVEVARMDGSGSSTNGSWQLEFDGTAQADRIGRGRDDRWGDDRRDDDRRGDDRWDRYDTRDMSGRGLGKLVQDVGGDFEFSRISVDARDRSRAVITLEGRRRTVRLVGSLERGSYGLEREFELVAVNDIRARGQFTLVGRGGDVESFYGDGRTDMGRFRISFSSR